MWIIDAPASRGGGIYRTDGVRVIGVPNRAWLDRFFFGGLIKHAGTAAEDEWDSYLDWDGRPRGAHQIAGLSGLEVPALPAYPVLPGRVADYARPAPEPLSCAEEGE